MTALQPETASRQTRDGLRLDADIYRPEGEGPWPVLLLRQAYGRKVASTVTYAHPCWYAAQGYVVVVEDVRGRGTSEGVFETLEHEAEDGADAIAWCAALPGTTGEVGMYGFSYQGAIQLLAAALAGPELKALAPAMIAWDIACEITHEGGIPALRNTVGWAAQVGADTARHQGDEEAYQALRAAANAPPLGDPVAVRPEVLTRFARYQHHERWLDAGADDAMWRRISPHHRVDALIESGVPMLFIGGWYDYMLAGTLAAWGQMHAVQPDRTRLLIGPWAHVPWASAIGGQDFGPSAASDVDRLQIAWFDHWLKGAPLDAEPVRLFDLGARRWSSSAGLGESVRQFFLSGDGRASIDASAGRLSDAPGTPGYELLVHDPWRPAPTVGGRHGAPAGPVDRREADQRGDLLTFTTDPLPALLAIHGWLGAVLHAEADMPSFDLHCTLSRITADGAVLPFAEGCRRIVADGGAVATEIDLKASCITLAAGERLRLSIAAASWPAFTINPGEGEPDRTPHIEAQVITIAIRLGTHHPSAIRLSLADAIMEPIA